MKIRRTLLALVATTFAFAAMPALASANPTHVDFSGSTNFALEGGAAKLMSPSAQITCTSVSGSGAYTSGTTGTLSLTLHGCKAPTFFNVACKSGATSGTITTTELTFHMEKVNGEPAVLITPNNGHFASFSCSFLASLIITGNGVIGTITNPHYNTASTTASVDFKQTEGVQEHTTIDGSELEYSLTASLNGGAGESAAHEGEGAVIFAEGGTGTLTE